MAKMRIINVDRNGKEIDITKVTIPKDSVIYDVIRSLDKKSRERKIPV